MTAGTARTFEDLRLGNSCQLGAGKLLEAPLMARCGFPVLISPGRVNPP